MRGTKQRTKLKHLASGLSAGLFRQVAGGAQTGFKEGIVAGLKQRLRAGPNVDPRGLIGVKVRSGRDQSIFLVGPSLKTDDIVSAVHNVRE